MSGALGANLAFGRQWSDQHHHLAALHLWKVLHLAVFFGVFGHTFQQFTTKVLVGHLATAETQRDFDLVAVLQKLEDIAHFHIVVIGIRIGSELDLFDLDDLLLFARFGFPLLLFVFELAKIHDLADRRIGIRGDFHQIQSGIFCHFHGAGRGNDSCVLSVGTDQANFVRSDFVVDARAGVSLRGRVVWSASDGDRPLIINLYMSA